MIKFSRREDYSVLIVYTLAKNFDKRLVPISEIANEYEISPLFLRNVAGDLRKAGIIKAVEGKSGGYYLTKDPNRLKIGKVLKIYSDTEHLSCCATGKTKSRSCPKDKYCIAETVWRKINKDYLDRLYAMTVTEFMNYKSTKTPN